MNTRPKANPLQPALLAAGERVQAAKDLLCRLDAQQGDGDHGVSMAKTFKAVNIAISDMPLASSADLLRVVGMTVLNEVGGAMGPLFGSAFRDAGKELAGPCTPASVAAALLAGHKAVVTRGGAAPGDKTMVDASYPAAMAAAEAAERGANVAGVLLAAADAAEAGVATTIDMIARRGRAARVGERSRGAADPGATSVSVILRALADSFAKTNQKDEP
jgi:dihydroxyacetone kinase-like protein